MPAYIYDAVRTIRGKARADGALAAFKPQELVGGLVDSLERRGQLARDVEALVLGCVDQVGDQGATSRSSPSCTQAWPTGPTPSR